MQMPDPRPGIPPMSTEEARPPLCARPLPQLASLCPATCYFPRALPAPWLGWRDRPFADGSSAWVCAHAHCTLLLVSSHRRTQVTQSAYQQRLFGTPTHIFELAMRSTSAGNPHRVILQKHSSSPAAFSSTLSLPQVRATTQPVHAHESDTAPIPIPIPIPIRRPASSDTRGYCPSGTPT
ncbi:hypothetical protein OH76DRAFT_656171 [Lentinus brumalis]|uniref:Uncharacterized protein n=1 Tax=Lentinus brumalis TaxID=2498619 RepID=A0A371D7H7_9APHY|nr:hypothetical protein OH76DRAFT_656171 [Polyporus brumalis]